MSDPTHAASTVTVQLVQGGTLVSADSHITVAQSSPTLTLTVEVSGAAGATREAVFAVTSATLTARADGYVRDGSYAETGYGTATTLVVKNATGTGYNRQAYLTFDTSAVIGTVTAATLSVYGFVSDSGGTQATVGSYAVDDTSWTETDLTWNTRPALGSALATTTATSTKSWLTFDVTSHVTAQGPGPVCVALAEAAAGLAVVLNSRESGSAPPSLRLTIG